MSGRSARERILQDGYPGYDTSVGWFQYEDDKVKSLAQQALQRGFRAFKLKVGSEDGSRDLRRAFMLRELAGSDAMIMLDANQQWTLPTAVRICRELSAMSPYFVEEPTHPDDIAAHKKLADAIAPTRIALGEHVPNRVMFKNMMQAGAVHFVQVDCTRVAGISEFITVSLLARKFGLPVVPHVGDMGQIHQHLMQLPGVRQDESQTGVAHGLKPDILSDHPPQHPLDLDDNIVQVHRAGMSNLFPAQKQQLLG